MKVAVIGTVGVPASYGGFETLVENIIDDSSVNFTVYCSGRSSSSGPCYYKGAKLVYIPLDANGVSSILYDVLSMMHALFSGHKSFLVLGVSGAIFLPVLSRFHNVRIITNIDGIEWRREKWKGFAKLFLKFSEYLAVKFSTCVVSDNEAITNYINERYKLSCKTIAYGGDHAFKLKAKVKLDDNLNALKPFALSICRIEPENNVHLILEAFSKAEFSIIFIGNWEKSAYGKELYSKYKDNINVTLLNPVYCLVSLHAYRAACSVYIHGHSAGGTNPSLVEMMHFSKSIIAYDCSFNRASMENKGNYFTGLDTLVGLLENMKLLQDGAVLAEIARRRYTWHIIRQQYLELFEI